jgi:hypothetical protein
VEKTLGRNILALLSYRKWVSTAGNFETGVSQNLGWRLYKILPAPRLLVSTCGLPDSAFGPWTMTEGPWKLISDFLLKAHRDHIHVTDRASLAQSEATSIEVKP